MWLTTFSTPFSRLTAVSAFRLTLAFTTCPDKVTVWPCASKLSVSNAVFGRDASVSWILHSNSSSVLPAHRCCWARAQRANNSVAHPVLEILRNESFLMPSVWQSRLQMPIGLRGLIQDFVFSRLRVDAPSGTMSRERRSVERGETGRHDCSPGVTTDCVPAQPLDRITSRE